MSGQYLASQHRGLTGTCQQKHRHSLQLKEAPANLFECWKALAKEKYKIMWSIIPFHGALQAISDSIFNWNIYNFLINQTNQNRHTDWCFLYFKQTQCKHFLENTNKMKISSGKRIPFNYTACSHGSSYGILYLRCWWEQKLYLTFHKETTEKFLNFENFENFEKFLNSDFISGLHLGELVR